MAQAIGPLDGLQVIELAEMVAGPFAGKLLADFGAEVIKIERPGLGDPSRRCGPFPKDHPSPERSGLFIYLNTNKLGMTLDIGQKAGRQILNDLLATCDIFITDLNAYRLNSLGLPLKMLSSQFPRLIITTVTPFGWEGPYAHWLGDELITYAMGGLAYGTPGMPDAVSDPESEPPLHPATYLAETVSGLVAAVASLLALLQRDVTGEGEHVDISQQASVAAMNQRDITAFSYAGLLSGRLPNTMGRMPNFYLPCKDGYVVVAAPLDHQWSRLVEALGRPEWTKSELFSTSTARSLHWDALKLLLLEWTMAHTGEEILQVAQKYRLPFFPFHSLAQIASSPHVQERRSLVDVERDGYQFQMPGPPVRPCGTPAIIRRPAPRLGEHTNEILRQRLHYDGEEVQLLFAAGVL